MFSGKLFLLVFLSAFPALAETSQCYFLTKDSDLKEFPKTEDVLCVSQAKTDWTLQLKRTEDGKPRDVATFHLDLLESVDCGQGYYRVYGLKEPAEAVFQSFQVTIMAYFDEADTKAMTGTVQIGRNRYHFSSRKLGT